MARPVRFFPTPFTMSACTRSVMSKAAPLVRLALMSALLLASIWSVAQVNSCTGQVVCSGYSLYYADCAPPLPPGAYNCVNNGPWSTACQVATYKCSPVPCPTCNEAKGGGPIDFATGNTDIAETDVRLPGLGGGLELIRTWNSLATSFGIFGQGWSSNLEERISIGGDGLVKDSRGDGSIWSFGWSSYTSDNSGSVYLMAGPRNGGSTLQVGPTTWTLTLKNGDKRIYDRPTGELLSIVDRNGNTTQLSYDSSNRLVTVGDPAARHLYFTYTQVMVGSVAVNLVTSVTSDVGVSFSYQYDSLGRLTKVIKPDNTFVTFQYSAANLITAVNDSDGKLLESHTYDALGRGLTSSRAVGADAITLTY
jgi:YD repeat-containing protein